MKILYNTGSEFKESKESAENLSVKVYDGEGQVVERTVQDVVTDNNTSINRFIGDEDPNDEHRSIRGIARDELTKQLVPENAEESLDTLKEIADWIQDHPESASQMNSRISTLEEAVPFMLYIQNGIYGYKKENGDFVPFKSQADIDAAVSAAMVGDAVAENVLAGKTFTNATTSGVTGTMPSRSNGESAVSTDRANGNRVFFPRGHYPNYATHDGQSWVKVTDEQIVNFANKQEKTVTSSTSDQTVTPDSGKLLSKVTVNKISPQRSLGTAATGSGIDSTGPYVYMPYGWWPEYSGKAGSSYTYMTAAQAVAACPKQEKSCTPSTSAQTVSPDSGKLLSKVSVAAIPKLHTSNSMIVPRWGTGPGSNVPATQIATRNPRVDFGNSNTYGSAEMVEIALPEGYYAWSYGNSSLCIPTETKTVTAGTSASTVSPTEYNTASKYVKFLKSVTVNPTPTQEKTVTAGTSAASVTPDSGKHLSKVTYNPTPTQEKTITASRSAQTVTPDSGKHLSKVTVNKYPDASGNYTCGSNNGAASSNDMGAGNNYRYVNATNVAGYGGRHCNWFGTSWGQMSWGTEKTASFTITASGVTNGESYLIRTNTYVTAVTGCTVRGGALNNMQQPTILVKATSTTIKATIFADSTWKCRTAEILTFGCDPSNI